MPNTNERNRKSKDRTAKELGLEKGMGRAMGRSFSDEGKITGRNRGETTGSWKDVENPMYPKGVHRDGKQSAQRTSVSRPMGSEYPRGKADSFSLDNPAKKPQKSVRERARVLDDKENAKNAMRNIAKKRR